MCAHRLLTAASLLAAAARGARVGAHAGVVGEESGGQNASSGEAAAVPAAPKCIGADGKAADFWYAFKFPGSWEYAYMDSKHKLHKRDDTLDDASSPLYKTLEELYKDHDKLTYAMWNDETGAKKKVGAPKAHAKGFMALSEKKQGIWLTHSVPAFPQEPGKARTPASSFKIASHKFGQSFLCISVDHSAIPTLVKMFEMDWMVIYASADNAGLSGEFSSWATDGQHVAVKDKENTIVTTLSSEHKQKFTMFAKSGGFHGELYTDLVASHFKRDFYAETWQNGKGKIPTWCQGSKHDHTVENVEHVSLPGGETFSETDDHSKWAVSMDGKVFCVGDINRQVGQTHRGGGTICIESPQFAKQMLDSIVDEEECRPAKKRRTSK